MRIEKQVLAVKCPVLNGDKESELKGETLLEVEYYHSSALPKVLSICCPRYLSKKKGDCLDHSGGCIYSNGFREME